MAQAGAAGQGAFLRFFAHESAGGIVLGIAALAALIVSNSPLAGWYEALLRTPGELVIGKTLVLEKTLLVWVNDLWMAVFFFLVGLEIKREFVEGELADRRQAVLPLAAALGGMAVPALIYSAINWGDAQALKGRAIPAATDIAFAIGIVMLLGSRVPLSLKVFLSAVAIIDDLGAIVDIALFTIGLLFGNAIGVVGTSWLMLRAGLATAPAGAGTPQLFGVCVLCGIGFTMSLFIGGLAFEGLDAGYETKLKLGVLAGSLLSALAGVAILVAAARLTRGPSAAS
jgi:Na+:H+ antiporter, NhaA family